MKVVIAGGRDFKGAQKHLDILSALHRAHHFTLVLCGGAKGADTFGAGWANAHSIPVQDYPADWEQYGRKAGPIRNEDMAMDADLVILFRGGRGTSHMRGVAQRMGIPVIDLRLI